MEGLAANGRVLRLAAAGLAALFFAAHIPYLASTLEDIDSVNFALGIHEFDPARHQPHPPGYPIFILLAKLSYAVLRDDARALAIWGVIFGSLAAFPLVRILWNLERLDRTVPDDWRLTRVLCAATVAMASPLYFFTASRPLSDLTGLAVILAAQAAIVAAFVRQRHDGETAASGRLIVIGALLAGLALGFRAQAAWLTLPLLLVTILDRTGKGAAGALLGSLMTFSIGVLLWAPALVVASGGWSRYVGAIGAQAGEDVGGEALFVSAPSVRRLVAELQHVFVRPWAMTPLAIVVLVLATVGVVVLSIRNRRALLVIASAVLPYLVFHLLFQETITVRYALPLVPPLAYLAVRGADALSPWLTRVTAMALATISLVNTHAALSTYAREGSPVSRAVSDMTATAATRAPGGLGMHFPFVRLLGMHPPAGVRVLAAPPKREWLSLVQYWKEGHRDPVWFLADPLRTDLALIDHAARKKLQRYGWSFATNWFLSGVRPDEAHWLTITPPGWFLEEGWALTPETAGLAAATGASPAARPIVGYVRRRALRSTLLVGGRNLGAAGDPDVRFTVRIDGRVIDEAAVKAQPGFFLRMVAIAPEVLNTGSGDYATLDVAAAAADGSGRAVKAAVEQFDIQPERAAVFGFDTGWHEMEYSPSLRRTFRWSSARAALRIHHAGRDVTLRMTGESPLRYFDAAPAVTVRAGDQILSRFTPDDDFDQTIRIPAAALDASRGSLVISTDRTFVPADRSRSPDRRQLGLRIFTLTVE